MVEINFYSFPNIDFGGDYRKTETFRLYQDDKLSGEIKSVLIKTFNPQTKAIKSIKIMNDIIEITNICDYLFTICSYEVKAQCNHTFITKLLGDDWIYVNFFVSDILEQKEFKLY